MGHYASEMGVDIPYDDFSKEAIEARKKDDERKQRLSAIIMEGLKYIGTDWFNKKSNI